jgi:ribosomal protein S18 acetylase RimI-like enzyme
MNISIREATEQDVPEIVNLIRELAASLNEESPVTEGYVKEYLQNPMCFILVAEIDNKVVGLISYSLKPNLYHASNSCLIEELVVDNAYRNKGIASKLIEKLFVELESIQCAEVSVSTEKTNEAAIAFYKKHGFLDEFLFLEKHF